MTGLEDLVAEVVASTDPVARAKGVRLTGAAVRGMPVYVDAAEMGRALRNLVTNAISRPDDAYRSIGTALALGERSGNARRRRPDVDCVLAPGPARH